ncbi:MORC family CW-type zinc finger protein 3-like isoform X2 [Salvelinus namaycush]|uniref:MORC family CW-type zinc finger protein 3-like isoform X2 n=1 Tax=Salvelinus namaycush TaxID=8040 RepID=A0A8U1F6G1_SALNM|nr:MORC family CW-type zinc finger protein 3-like isoform X2 [Salvelinus namaycush]
MASQRGVPISKLCPKFLHTNSTSHTWPFSAIAELIDNAYDPDVNAKQFWIDKTQIKDQDCLIFMDNGNGLDYEKMHKMLSFGYSDKRVINGKYPIGLYGNGFKSGSMRLGKDAIVFSKSQDGDTMQVGMLSQSYLAQIKADEIIVPIISFQCVPHSQYKFYVNEKHKASLQDILRYSIFNTENELLEELKAISSTGSSGTRIIVWNLRRTITGPTEFDFTTFSDDIKIPLDVLESTIEQYRQSELLTKPESYYSLRAYCSILYLKPRMQIIIRGQKVKTELISKSLAYIAKDHYKPNFVNRRIPVTFGYNTKSKDQYGIMMYHKNRLIKAYERVGVQLKANIQGLGVIGVIECNFLEPTHNKQDFDNTDKYRKTINNLGLKLEDYWKEIRFKRNKEDPSSTTPVEDTMKRPDQNWVQCDTCLRWRKLPDGIDCKRLPKEWFCHMNPDPQFSERNTKMKPDKKRQQNEDEQKPEQMQIKALAQNKTLKHQRISCLTKASPSTPPAPSTPSNPRMKRTLAMTPARETKRPRLNGFHNNTPMETVSPAAETTMSSTLVVIPVDDDDDNIMDDEDIMILEINSTPIQKKATFDLAMVKSERRAMETPSGTGNVKTSCTGTSSVETGTAATSYSPPPPSSEQVSITTQTKIWSTVKDEDEEHKEEKGRDRTEPGPSTPNPPSAGPSTLGPSSSGPSAPDPSDHPMIDFRNLSEAQEQQDQLLELMQAAAHERDQFKEQVIKLTSQLHNLEGSMQELSQATVKGEHCHQACQTGEGGEEGEQSERIKVEIIEEERGNLWSLCETLQQDVVELRREKQEWEREKQERDKQEKEKQLREKQESEGAQTSADQAERLRELRRSIGRLLVTFVPALDLEQVNYDCSVIDEILDQVLTDVESMGPV